MYQPKDLGWPGIEYYIKMLFNDDALYKKNTFVTEYSSVPKSVRTQTPYSFR